MYSSSPNMHKNIMIIKAINAHQPEIVKPKRSGSQRLGLNVVSRANSGMIHSSRDIDPLSMKALSNLPSMLPKKKRELPTPRRRKSDTPVAFDELTTTNANTDDENKTAFVTVAGINSILVDCSC